MRHRGKAPVVTGGCNGEKKNLGSEGGNRRTSRRCRRVGCLVAGRLGRTRRPSEMRGRFSCHSKLEYEGGLVESPQDQKPTNHGERGKAPGRAHNGACRVILLKVVGGRSSDPWEKSTVKKTSQTW